MQEKEWEGGGKGGKKNMASGGGGGGGVGTWEIGTCIRPLKPEDWKLVQNSSSTLVLRVTVRPMWSPGVMALLGISSPTHLALLTTSLT